MFEHSVPGLPERAAAEGLTPLEYMRRYGAFEIARGVGARHEEPVPAAELDDVQLGPHGRVYTRAPKPPSPNIVPDAEPRPRRRRPPPGRGRGRRRGAARLPDAVGQLEFYSATLADWGWPEYALPTYIRSHVHPDRLEPRPDGADLDLPAADPDPHAQRQRQVARRDRPHQPALDPSARRRAAAAAHRRPGPGRDRDRPLRGQGVGHRGHPPRRGRLQPPHGPLEARRARGQRQSMATVDLQRDAGGWAMRRRAGRRAVRLDRPGHPAHLVDRRRRAPEPDLPGPPRPDLRHALLAPGRARAPGGRRRPAGDISVDTATAHAVYERWLRECRPAEQVSPDGTRRPYWLLRPLKPARDAYRLPTRERTRTR